MPKKVSTKELEALLKLNSAIGLEPIMGLVDKTRAIDEFVAALPQIVKMFTEIKSSLGDEKRMFKEHCATVIADMKEKAETTVKDIKAALNVEREKLDAKTQASLSLIDTRLAEIEDSIESQMGEIETRLTPEPEVEEPEDEPEPDLQSAIDSLRVELQSKIDELRQQAKQSLAGSGNVTNLRIQQAFKYILKTESPIGDIDGVNTEYTVTQAIFAILSFSINGETIAQLPNYTVNGKKIVFSSPLPAAYSGKDFEVKYI